MPQTIAFFGKKQSGKGSCATFLSALNLVSYRAIDKFQISNEHQLIINDKSVHVNEIAPQVVKIYSFAEEIKNFCVEKFGVDKKLVFGTDEQKSHHTHLRWEDFPGIITNKRLYKALIKTHKKHRDLYGIEDPLPVIYKKPGFITGRELLQFFGTEVCRKIHQECWVESLFKKINKENPIFAMIADGRFDNELDYCDPISTTIYLTRDKFNGGDTHASENGISDIDRCNLIIDNNKLTLKETLRELVSEVQKTNILAPIQ